MASKPAEACCTITNLHQGKSVGKFHGDLFGLPSYESGDIASSKIVVIATDIYGFDYNNVNLVADALAAHDYYVLVPDLLKGDNFVEGGDLGLWLESHDVQDASKVYGKYVAAVKQTLKPLLLAGIGYCYGAKAVVQELGNKGSLDVGAISHPSFVTIEDIEAVAKPLFIGAAQHDSIFTVELRHKTEEILNKNNQSYQINLYQGVSHGYSIRGDVTDPNVKYAKENTFEAEIEWFKRYTETTS